MKSLVADLSLLFVPGVTGFSFSNLTKTINNEIIASFNFSANSPLIAKLSGMKLNESLSNKKSIGEYSPIDEAVQKIRRAFSKQQIACLSQVIDP